MSVNCETTSAAPPTSSTERSNRPSSSGKIRSRATLPARRKTSSCPSSRATPRSTQSPRPTSPPGVARARATRCTTARMPRTLVQVADARPVLLRRRLEGARELVVPVRLEVPALLLETTSERVVRVVVDRRELEHLAELLLGFAPAPDPEVRDPECLADRRLVRLTALRLLQRDGGLGGHARSQVAAPALEEAVRRLAHDASAAATGRVSERSESRPRRRSRLVRPRRAPSRR